MEKLLIQKRIKMSIKENKETIIICIFGFIIFSLGLIIMISSYAFDKIKDYTTIPKEVTSYYDIKKNLGGKINFKVDVIIDKSNNNFLAYDIKTGKYFEICTGKNKKLEKIFEENYYSNEKVKEEKKRPLKDEEYKKLGLTITGYPKYYNRYINNLEDTITEKLVYEYLEKNNLIDEEIENLKNAINLNIKQNNLLKNYSDNLTINLERGYGIFKDDYKEFKTYMTIFILISSFIGYPLIIIMTYNLIKLRNKNCLKFIKNKNLNKKQVINDIKKGFYSQNIILGEKYIIVFLINSVDIYKYDEIVWAYLYKESVRRQFPVSEYDREIVTVDIKEAIVPAIYLYLVDNKGKQNRICLYKKVYSPKVYKGLQKGDLIIEKLLEKNKNIYIGYNEELENIVSKNINDIFTFNKNLLNKDNIKTKHFESKHKLESYYIGKDI